MNTYTKNNSLKSDQNGYPSPKFKVGQFVNIRGRKGMFHIYTPPIWNEKFKQWSYPYDYGLGNTSEGYEIESCLELISNKDKTK